MSATKPVFALAVLAGAAVVAVVVVVRLKTEHEEVMRVVDDIEAQLAGLDRVQRASVVTRLSVRAVRDLKEMRT